MDYCLACQLGGAEDDLLIICNLPLYLADSSKAWLEHLPERLIRAGPTWSGSLLGIFKARTCTLETPGTSGVAVRSQMSLSKTSLGVSQSSAPSSPISQTPTSLGHSSLAPLARSSYTSSNARPPRAPASCSTSPPISPSGRRQLEQSFPMAVSKGSRRSSPPRLRLPRPNEEEEGSQRKAGSAGRQPCCHDGS